MKLPAVRVLAAASVLAVASLMVMPASASASVSGPSVKHVRFQWVPGTGNVHVKAVASCDPKLTKALWKVDLGQPGAWAQGSVDLRCDGKEHAVHMLLDPKRHRFHPGHAAVSLTAVGCTERFCSIGIGDGFATIDRPGKAKGPRGSR